MRVKQSQILVRLYGGLGNQLFQMFAGLKASKLLSNDNNKQNISLLTDFLSGYNQPRNYEIDFIVENFPSIVVGKSGNPLLNLSARARVARILDISIFNYSFINSIEHLSTLSRGWDKKILLDGYFQDPFILPSEEERISLRESLFKKCSSLISSIKGDKKSIGLHIRRGDYLSSSVFAILPLEYYRIALDAFIKNNNEYSIFIFSDDSIISESFACEVGGINISSMNLSLSDEFCLLASCDHYIIANSTFSWWASYIGKQEYSKIFSPKNWYTDSRINKLLLDNFNLIG